MTTTASSSAFRKYFLLALFCVAQFLDTLGVSALFSAIPVLSADLSLNSSESVWLLSAYQLTFAAFLLVSGRISDVYNPKYAFVGGAFALGAFSLAAGFVHDKIGLLVLRAISGIAAAMTIPSSLTLLVRLFPGEKEQARAISIFGGSAALGNVLGLVIGALFIEFATWSWVFWLGAILAIPISILCAFLVPAQAVGDKTQRRIVNLDLPGISILTSALLLLVFALTSSGTVGWATGTVLAPLLISLLMIAAFFVWEARIPADRAAFPPKTWFYPNFAILFGVALSIFLWFTTVFLLKISLWQEVYGWSPIKSAIHLLPMGLIAGPIMLFSGPFTSRFQPKHVILVAQGFLVVSSTILPFADAPGKYWTRDFPALVVGAIGGSLLFVNANVAVFHNTPPAIAGTVGAIFNSALQLGSAVGIAVITSVEEAVDGARGYRGRAAGFWLLLALVVVEMSAVAALYRVSPPAALVDEESATPSEKAGTDSDAATLCADCEDGKPKSALATPVAPLSRRTSLDAALSARNSLDAPPTAHLRQ